jgi:hypothetical protein
MHNSQLTIQFHFFSPPPSRFSRTLPIHTEKQEKFITQYVHKFLYILQTYLSENLFLF